MNIGERIDGFAQLGKYLREYVELQGTEEANPYDNSMHAILDTAIIKAGIENPWFTRENILFSLECLSVSLEKTNIERFLHPYSERISKKEKPGVVGVIMAGNIPLVGFHDFFCSLMAGHHFLGKLSTDDQLLMPAIAGLLCAINPEFRELISFSDGKLSGFNAIIATGSNNTNRYFEYYFGKYPNILRKSRNGLAVITGNETDKELAGLADDIFMYFGRGCRSVSKLFLPEQYDFNSLFLSLKKYRHVTGHNKFNNNYNYHKAIFLLENVPFIDCGNLILAESPELASPVSVVYYEYYSGFLQLRKRMAQVEDRVQCIVCIDESVARSVRPGTAQRPELWEYADGIDTMEFLLDL